MDRQHIVCLTHYHELGDPWPNTSMIQIASDDFLDGMVYAHTHGCTWNEDTTAVAVSYDAFRCLEYAVENGCPMSPVTIRCAMIFGNLRGLRYAHENGASFFDVGTTLYAVARNGSLNIIRYLFEHCRHEIKYEDSDLCENEDSPDFSPEVREYLQEIAEDWKNTCYDVKPAKQ